MNRDQSVPKFRYGKTMKMRRSLLLGITAFVSLKLFALAFGVAHAATLFLLVAADRYPALPPERQLPAL
jgi:hypothetical protein